jgi:hypothetical protein
MALLDVDWSTVRSNTLKVSSGTDEQRGLWSAMWSDYQMHAPPTPDSALAFVVNAGPICAYVTIRGEIPRCESVFI